MVGEHSNLGPGHEPERVHSDADPLPTMQMFDQQINPRMGRATRSRPSTVGLRAGNLTIGQHHRSQLPRRSPVLSCDRR